MIVKTVLTLALILLCCVESHAFTTKLLSEIPQQAQVSGLTFDAASDTAAAISVEGKTLTIIDTASFSVRSIVALPMEPSAVAIHHGSGTAIVGATSGELRSYDLKSGEGLSTATIGTTIYAIAVDEIKNRAMVGTDQGFRVVDLPGLQILSKIDIPEKAQQVVYTKIGAIAVTRSEVGSKLTVLDPESGKVVAETPLPGHAMSIGIDEKLNYVLVTLEESPGVLLYDAAGLKPLVGIQCDRKLEIVSVNQSTHVAALSDTVDGSLAIVDLAGKKVVESVPLYGKMGPLCLDTSLNRVLVGHNASIMVVQLQNPIPVITGLVPWERAADNDSFSLAITGEKFLKNSRTRFNKGDYASQFESNELIKAEIPADQLLTPGDVPVTVVNPPPGGGVSNEVKFKVLTPAPVLSALLPAQIAVGGPDLTLRVEGKNFLPSATVNFNEKFFVPNYISSTVLEARISAVDVSNIGNYVVSVNNNGNDKFISNTLSFRVVTAEEAVTAATSASSTESPNQGFGSLTGTVLNTEMMPLPGATITSKGISTETDALGRFTLTNLPAGKRTVIIDGSTVEDPAGHYPTIPISVDIQAGVNNTLPFTPYFHRQKNRNFVNIDPSTDTVLTDPEVPGFELRIPKGVKITGWDGKANLKVSVRTVATDRLPLKPLPKNANARTVYMFYFGKVGGGKPDRPIPVKARNDLGLLPGEKATLWFYDESPNEGDAPNDWAIAGTGTVTPDGRFIVSDPGVGIPKFCCGASTYGGSGSSSGSSGSSGSSSSSSSQNNSGGGGDGISPSDCGPNAVSGNAGDPVNVATGYFIYDKSDYKVNGIIPFEIKRYYRSGDDGQGAFGKGTYFGFDWWLGVYQDMLLLLKPGNYQYRFSKQADGTYINTTDPEYQGDVFMKNADGTFTLKKKNGWSYKFGTDKLLDQITNSKGSNLTFLKQIDGNISSIILPDGGIISINYNIGGINGRDCITSISGPIGKVNYSYSGGKLQSVQYPDGSLVSYGYDTSGRMTTVTENGNLLLTNTYNADNRVITQSRPDGALTTFSYTLAAGNITETDMTAPNGALTKWRFYDDSGTYRNGYVTFMTTPDGETKYEREIGSNLVKSITDPLGRQTSYTYDTKGRVLTKTDPLQNTTQYQYEDACSNQTQKTDALGKITNFTYTFASGTCCVLHAEIQDPLNNLTKIDFNNAGMPTRVVDPNGNATTITYDNSNPSLPTAVTDALGNTHSYTYDPTGRRITATDAKGGTTKFGYDGVTERISNITDSLNGITQFSYDLNGNLTLFSDPKGNKVIYTYDDRNRVIKMTDQLGRSENYFYYRGSEITATTGDNLKTFIDRKGQVTTYSQYDPQNRVKMVTFNDGAVVQYAYDAAGRPTSIYDSTSGTISYSYNDYGCPTCSGRGLDLIAQETTPLGTVSYTYDSNGRRSSMTAAGAPTVTYLYDGAGRLTSISRIVGLATRTYNLGYDSGGRRTSLQIPLAIDNITTVTGYDVANRIVRMLVQGKSATLEDLTYAYDSNGNRTSFGRLAPHALSPTVENSTFDDANEMVGSNGKLFTYDANGNLQGKMDACGTTNYTWDARNRLTGLEGFQEDCTALTASFRYDAVGRRFGKTINGADTQYVYDGTDIIQELQNGVTTDFIRALNIDEPLTAITGATVSHYLRDALGSVVALANDAGVVQSTYIYDVYGNVSLIGNMSNNPFQFTGRENDGDGLYYYRARYYSSKMQRFLSEDPSRLWGGDINYFVYAKNNPINYIDPSGRSLFDPGNNFRNVYPGGGGGRGPAPPEPPENPNNPPTFEMLKDIYEKTLELQKELQNEPKEPDLPRNKPGKCFDNYHQN